MSLSAAVFLHRDHLPVHLLRRFEYVDALTGKPIIAGDPPLEEITAASADIGNISQIAYLRGWISEQCGELNICLKEVLYSGSHSGDAIAVSSIDNVERELERILSLKNIPEDVSAFTDHFAALVKAARREGNPIVFI